MKNSPENSLQFFCNLRFQSFPKIKTLRKADSMNLSIHEMTMKNYLISNYNIDNYSQKKNPMISSSYMTQVKNIDINSLMNLTEKSKSLTKSHNQKNKSVFTQLQTENFHQSQGNLGCNSNILLSDNSLCNSDRECTTTQTKKNINYSKYNKPFVNKQLVEDCFHNRYIFSKTKLPNWRMYHSKIITETNEKCINRFKKEEIEERNLRYLEEQEKDQIKRNIEKKEKFSTNICKKNNELNILDYLRKREIDLDFLKKYNFARNKKEELKIVRNELQLAGKKLGLLKSVNIHKKYSIPKYSRVAEKYKEIKEMNPVLQINGLGACQSILKDPLLVNELWKEDIKKSGISTSKKIKKIIDQL